MGSSGEFCWKYEKNEKADEEHGRIMKKKKIMWLFEREVVLWIYKKRVQVWIKDDCV